MIRTPHVSLDFKSNSIPDKIVFGNNVCDKLTLNNSTYSSPDIPVPTLRTKISALAIAAQQALSGDHQKVVAMHATEKEMEISLETEAHYVDRIAGGNENTIALSGFRATASQTQAVVNPPAVTGIKITVSQQSGGIHIDCDVIHGVSGYMFFVSTTPASIVFQNKQFPMQNNPGVIFSLTDIHRKVDFTNLPSGIILYLTVIAFNSAGIGAAHAPITFKTL